MKIKKKLRDVTDLEYRDWIEKKCGSTDCSKCMFNTAKCDYQEQAWVFHKDLYSDKFLDQELEIEVPDILDEEEKEYLEAVIKPFRNRIIDITKYNTGEHNEYQYIRICVESVNHSRPSGCYANDCINLPPFKNGEMYRKMEINKNYKLKELGLFQGESKKYKITLKEFWNSENTLAIHCDTEEKAKKLLKAFDKLGKSWDSGISYLACTYFKINKEKMCYLNNRFLTDLDNAKKNNYTTYEFENVDLEN